MLIVYILHDKNCKYLRVNFILFVFQIILILERINILQFVKSFPYPTENSIESNLLTQKFNEFIHLMKEDEEGEEGEDEDEVNDLILQNKHKSRSKNEMMRMKVNRQFVSGEIRDNKLMDKS